MGRGLLFAPACPKGTYEAKLGDKTAEHKTGENPLGGSTVTALDKPSLYVGTDARLGACVPYEESEATEDLREDEKGETT